MSQSSKIRLYFDGFEALTWRRPPSPWRLVKWRVAPGSHIESGTVVAEFEDDNMVVEHEVFYSGIFHPLIQEGQEIRPHDQVAWMAVSEEEFRTYLANADNRCVMLRLTEGELRELESARGDESLTGMVQRLFRAGMERELGFKSVGGEKSSPPSDS